MTGSYVMLEEILRELPNLDGVEEVVINREVAQDGARPIYIYGDRRDDLDSSA